MKDKYLRKLNITLIDGDFENALKDQVRTPEQVYELFKKLKDESQETLLGLYLDDDLTARLYSVLSVGSSQCTQFDPSELYRHVILTKSKLFVVVHNHPQGDPAPSPEDKLAMTELHRGSKDLRLTFLDFIIVGTDRYWSLFEAQEGGEYSLGSVA